MNDALAVGYTVTQPLLNLLFGFVWGVVAGPFRYPLKIWLALLFFVSVRIVGDWLFSQPHIAFEWLRLYVYATLFFIGAQGARWLRVGYGREGSSDPKRM